MSAYLYRAFPKYIYIIIKKQLPACHDTTRALWENTYIYVYSFFIWVNWPFKLNHVTKLYFFMFLWFSLNLCSYLLMQIMCVIIRLSPFLKKEMFSILTLLVVVKGSVVVVGYVWFTSVLFLSTHDGLIYIVCMEKKEIEISLTNTN